MGGCRGLEMDLEDDFNDIISKAQKGLGISTEELAEKTGVSEGVIRGLRRGELNERALDLVAGELGLKVEALQGISKGEWKPEEVGEIVGFEAISTPFYDWQVNSFLLWDAESKKAICFDTGTTADPILAFLKEKGLSLEALILTHTHRDHTEGLAAMRKELGDFKVLADEKEEVIPQGATLIGEGWTRAFGGCSIRGFETTGHTRGGLSFVIEGLSKPIVVVGDALFAGSMGGPNGPYADSLRAVERILELDEETVVAPGHGCMSTVGEERRMNPFFGMVSGE